MALLEAPAFFDAVTIEKISVVQEVTIPTPDTERRRLPVEQRYGAY